MNSKEIYSIIVSSKFNILASLEFILKKIISIFNGNTSTHCRKVTINARSDHSCIKC